MSLKIELTGYAVCEYNEDTEEGIVHLYNLKGEPMNSIHDNQATIEKEKQTQLENEKRAAEVTEATKALTQNQTETAPEIKLPSEEELKNAAPLFSEEDLKAYEKKAEEENAENKKLREENEALKKFISENSLHTEAQKLKEELKETPKQDAIDYDQQS